jgi:hypothetical protein
MNGHPKYLAVDIAAVEHRISLECTFEAGVVAVLVHHHLGGAPNVQRLEHLRMITSAEFLKELRSECATSLV